MADQVRLAAHGSGTSFRQRGLTPLSCNRPDAGQPISFQATSSVISTDRPIETPKQT